MAQADRGLEVIRVLTIVEGKGAFDMPADPLISMVERYFAAVDAQQLDDILALMSEDCVFSVETHGVVLKGHAEITGMFRRLWSHHRAVRHHKFRYVSDGARVSVQFQVENTELDGSLTRKSNCNFFDARDGRFTAVAVYMAGANTLDR